MLSNDVIEQRLNNNKCECHLCNGKCKSNCPVCKKGGCSTCCKGGKSLIDKVIEKLPSSDDTARPRFPGELHAILKLPNGKPGIANYMGPGTHVVERIKRGDPPRTYTDKIAQAHDIRYGLAKSQEEVAAADRKFISSIKAAKGKDADINIQMGLRPIQAKVFLEEKGIVKPGKIASFGDIKSEDLPIVKSKLAELESIGLGGELDILKRKNLNYISNELKQKTDLVIKNKSKAEILGSFVFRSQTYPADIDLHEIVSSDKNAEDAYHKMYLALKTITKRLLSQRGVYFGEVKAGLDKRYKLDINDKQLRKKIIKLFNDGLIDDKQVDKLLKLESTHLINHESHDLLEEELRKLQIIRWNEKEVEQGYKILKGGVKLSLQDAMRDETVIKIDIWAPIEGKYTEISNMFFTVLEKPGNQIQLLNSEAGDYMRELYHQVEKYGSPAFYNPFKMLKRIWNIARFTDNDKLVKQVTPMFQGDVARINQISSEIGTIILMVENLKKSFPTEAIIKQIDDFKNRLSFVYEFEYGEVKVMKLIDQIISLFIAHIQRNRRKMIIKKLEELKDHLNDIRNKQTEKFLKSQKIGLHTIKYILKQPMKIEVMPFILKAVHADD